MRLFVTAACLMCFSCCTVLASADVPAPPLTANIRRQSDDDRSNRCEWLDKAGKEITRFSVLPGGGWDNLRNRDMGLVADLSFHDCALSGDGTYVVPSHVVLFPKRESHVSLMSQVMEHYENYSSTTSLSVNTGGNGIFHGIGIDGKFSEEFQQVKRTALSSKTQLGRTQQRYNMYTARLQPDFRFSESFSGRLVDIGNALINNQTGMARYLADLVVRDFGTHVVTSMDAGAILEKVDYFNRNSLTTSVFTSNKLSQCLSVDFAKVFGFKYDMSLSVTTEEMKQYINSVQKTAVNAHGGPPVGNKINLTEWEAQLRENLVPIDKTGEPLFSVISERSLPQIPLPRIVSVIDAVKDAVLRYYKANEVKGCQDPNSPNFDPLANLDGICQPPLTNFSFAGVYQTCQESNPSLGLGLCGGAGSPVQKNPITGGFSCPAGYEPVKLLTAAGETKRRCYERHKSCWLVFSCHDGYDCYSSSASLSSYWCAASPQQQSQSQSLPQDSGMLYGGAYSPRFNNPATDAKACGGAGYRPYTIGRDISVCLSADMSDAAMRARLPMGGFFTCQAGNPLAQPGRHVVAANSQRLRLSAAVSPSPAPKRCPDGFSQSTVDLVDGCALMQCTRGGDGSSLRRSVARRPPFEAADFRYAGPPVTTMESAGRRWRFNGTSWLFSGYDQQPMQLSAGAGASGINGGSSDGGNSVGSIVSLVCLVAAIGLVIMVALAVAYKRRWHVGLRRRLRREPRRQQPYRQLDDRAAEALVAGGSSATSHGYGAVNDAEVVMETPPPLPPSTAGGDAGCAAGVTFGLR